MKSHAYLGDVLIVMLAPLCWAGNFVLAKHLQSEITAIQLNFWRWFLACLVLTPFVARDLRQLVRDMLEHLPILIAQSLMGIAVYHCLVYYALKSTSAINATLINSLVPMFIPLFAFIAFRQRLAPKHWIAIALSTLGVAVVVTQGRIEQLRNLHLATGDFLMVIAAMIWAIYTLLLSRKPSTIAGMRFLWCLSFIGTLLLTPAFFLDLARHGPFPNTMPNWLSVGYVALFAAVFAFLAWNYGATKFPASHLGMFAHLMPAFGSLLAIVFLGESFRTFHAIGMTLIGAGLCIIFSGTSGSRPEREVKALRAR
ncbi:DMT family transporter [Paraburkholderia sp. J67]|uniref:DMT family transporter n=1 Tax=Paraburkholderia sp. J67 TaxID=2805435 RepID=UPI002ABDE86E|nr:DMT family transporter [Paraburkholderia sp. J67]